jgi:hypothetical protein
LYWALGEGCAYEDEGSEDGEREDLHGVFGWPVAIFCWNRV